MVSSNLKDPQFWNKIEKYPLRLKHITSDGLWALDTDSNLLKLNKQYPTGWEKVQTNTNYVKLFSGPNKELLGKKNDFYLTTEFAKRSSENSGLSVS